MSTVLLDFSAALDLIDYEMLLMKLAAYGFNTSTHNWIRVETGYVSNRTGFSSMAVFLP